VNKLELMMKTKSFFSLSLMTAGLLAGTALSAPASAADLHAQTGWAISRVASMTQGSYCTMAQKFDSNAVFTIAKNNGGEYSLAFDFQAPKFSLDKELTTSVKAGAGSTQTFTVHAQSPQAIVINLGKDEGFVSELRQSGKVQLDVDGKSYTFNTAKFSEAQDELDTCVSAKKAQIREAKEETSVEETTEKTVSAAAPAHAPSKSAQSSISAEDLVLAPVDTPASSPVVQKKTPIAQDQAKAQEQAKKESIRLADDLEKSRQDLAKTIEQNKVSQEQLVPARKAQTETSQKSEGDRQSAQALELAQHETQMLKEENQALKNQLQAETKNKPAAPAVDPAAEENLRNQIRDLKSQLEIAQSESTTLKAQIDKVQKETESGQLKVAGGNWDLEQATRRYQESQREIRRLGALLEQDRVKCKEEKKDIEYMLFDPEVTKSAQIAKLGELEDQIQTKDKRIAELETALKSGNKSDDKTSELKAKDEQIAELEAALKSSEKSSEKADEIQAKDARIAELEATLKSSEKSNDKTDELQAKDQRIAELEAALKSGEKSNEKAEKKATAKSDKKEDAAQPAAAQQTADNSKTAEAAKEPSIWERLLSADATSTASDSAKPAAKSASTDSQAVKAQQPPVQTVVVSHTGLQSPEEFANLLQAAGVNIQGAVQPLKQRGISDTYKAYSWHTGGLSGSAEQRLLRNRDGFEPAVQEYISRAKSRCGGEFNAVPAQIRLIGVNMAEGYEMSCTGSQSGSSASVLFSYRDGVLTTISHEGNADAMNVAMNVRDRIAAKIIAN
jgi:hypothetical protein